MLTNQSKVKLKYGDASPTISLNDNLICFGKELHVQTENVPSDKLVIRTHVFLGGRVIYSKKTEYTADAVEIADFRIIRGRMQAQHLKVMEIISEQQVKPPNNS